MIYHGSLEQVTELNKDRYLELYRDHYGIQVLSAQEVCLLLRLHYKRGQLLYYSTISNVEGDILSAMAINSMDLADTQFQFSHLVTHTDYRQKGLAKKTIYNGAKFLVAAGAKLIQNHKRMNVIPSRYFEHMGFTEKLVDNEKYPEYKYLYTLDVDKANLPHLMNL